MGRNILRVVVRGWLVVPLQVGAHRHSALPWCGLRGVDVDVHRPQCAALSLSQCSARMRMPLSVCVQLDAAALQHCTALLAPVLRYHCGCENMCISPPPSPPPSPPSCFSWSRGPSPAPAAFRSFWLLPAGPSPPPRLPGSAPSGFGWFPCPPPFAWPVPSPYPRRPARD